MHRGRRLAILLLAVFLTGCVAGQDAPEKVDTRRSGADAGETGAGMDLQKAPGDGANPQDAQTAEAEQTQEPVSDIVGICVNRTGYITDAVKLAVFCGSELPQEFEVIRQADGETVFTGTLKDQGYRRQDQEYTGYGDFSQVQEPGGYYIEAPVLGRSYFFEIGDSVYEDALRELSGRYVRYWEGGAAFREERSVLEAVRETAVLLLACELNGDCLSDETGAEEGANGIPDLLDGIRSEVQWLLEMQDAQTGAVCGDPARGQEEEGEGGGQSPDPVSSAAFAMALARFSYLYQDYDTQFATECLKAADRAWVYVEQSGSAQADGWRFAAAAELYRASGRKSFHDYVAGYLSEKDYQSRMDESMFWGCAAYLSTRQPVELSLCEEITRALMAWADEAARAAQGSPFLARECGPDGDCGKLLEDGMYLSLVNHMVSSREYELVVENCLHYLLGRNRLSVSYPGEGEEDLKTAENETLKPPGRGSWGRAEDGSMIFLLSETLCWQREHGE